MRIIFLSPYSPSLAPIELIFRWIKRRLANNLVGTRLSLKLKEALQTLFRPLKILTKT